MKILYVEDNPANLYLVKRIAKSGQHEIINYIDGEEALKDFDKIQADLVLLDIQLAGEMSGLDVVRELRKRGHKTYVVAVTAYAMVGDKERCLAAGFDDYMAKPLPIQRLMELFNHPITEAVSHRTDEVKAVTGGDETDDEYVAKILANPTARGNEITQEIQALLAENDKELVEITEVSSELTPQVDAQPSETLTTQPSDTLTTQPSETLTTQPSEVLPTKASDVTDEIDDNEVNNEVNNTKDVGHLAEK